MAFIAQIKHLKSLCSYQNFILLCEDLARFCSAWKSLNDKTCDRSVWDKLVTCYPRNETIRKRVTYYISVPPIYLKFIYWTINYEQFRRDCVLLSFVDFSIGTGMILAFLNCPLSTSGSTGWCSHVKANSNLLISLIPSHLTTSDEGPQVET